MRGVKVFSGSSHPKLTIAICERLGISPARCDLAKFSNGETNVNINTSIRNQDVFIVQSGSKRTNDSVMELLIMISACKGGSAKSITAVLPYFPYSRQSKKKSHRGAITARMLANLLSVAGVNHVITVDLHAPPMQGFFGKPVDNLYAEPVIARWIRMHVKEWRDAVVVSKNPGGSKRVTSLADALKLSFAIITTDRRRSPPGGSTILDSSMILGDIGKGSKPKDEKMGSPREHRSDTENANGMQSCPGSRGSPKLWGNNNGVSNLTPISPVLSRHSQPPFGNSPLQQSSRVESESPPSRISLPRSESPLSAPRDSEQTPSGEEYTDERAREVITGRFVQGHIVDDDFPSPMLSTMSGSVANLASLGPSQFEDRDPMTSSLMSAASSAHLDSGLGEKFKPNELSDEEDEGLKNPEVEHTVTLVGDVRGKTVIIIDDIMDGCESWIAAAETVVKRGGATKVYCIATHGLFGEGSLERLEDCDCINHILVCNTFPLDPQRSCYTKKLEILDLSGMLSEAIRRNHHGESITQLYQQYVD